VLKDRSRTADKTKAIVVVTGMRSDNCASKVNSALTKVKGVESVVVDWPRNEVIITYDSGTVDTGTLGHVIQEVGYNVGGVI